MTKLPTSDQISFRYQAEDNNAGITRATAQKLARQLGVDEEQAIHLALRQLALKVLPQYEPDDGPLTPGQLEKIKQTSPQGAKRSLRSSLIDL